jgi:hypothetical protein
MVSDMPDECLFMSVDFAPGVGSVPATPDPVQFKVTQAKSS